MPGPRHVAKDVPGLPPAKSEDMFLSGKENEAFMGPVDMNRTACDALPSGLAQVCELLPTLPLTAPVYASREPGEPTQRWFCKK